MPLAFSARLAALVALVALPALADGRSARLLTEADAPLLAMASPAAAAQLVPAAVEVAQVAPGPSYGAHFVKTFAAGVFGSAAGTVLAGVLAPVSINLIATAVPFLLVQLLVAPAITVLAALLIGNEGAFEGRYAFWGAFGVTTLVHAAVFAVASLFLTVAWSNPVSMLVYTLVDGFLMTGGAVGLMHLTAKKPVAAVIPSFVPGVSDTQLVSMGKVEL